MKRRLCALTLALTLALALAVPASAAGDAVFSQNTTLTKFRNVYDNVTVKAGVTLTMKQFSGDPQGLEIGKSLTVESGGSITGGGVIIFSRGATCSGMPLYYRVAGEEKPLTATLDDILAREPHNDYQPNFLYSSETGHYVLIADFAVDPFAEPEPPADPAASTQDARLLQTAEKLKSLGLFLGGDGGFALDRAPTRVEEVVMLLRLLGNKDTALKAYPAENCPFDDVPAWARSYVAYAYDKGLTKGVSDSKFGAEVPATVQQFETFVLRAMGYSDADGDFSWEHPETLAETLGIVLGSGDVEQFSRGTCVKITEIALRNAMKDGTRLYEKLAADGAFTVEQYRTAFGGN